MEVYKFSGCGVSYSIVLFKKPTNKQQTINKQKISAGCYCGVRYAYIQLLAFLALEHAWRCSGLKGASDVKAVTCFLAGGGLLHLRLLKYQNRVEELSFLLTTYTTLYPNAESASLESGRSMFPAWFGKGFQLFSLREDKVTMALYDNF